MHFYELPPQYPYKLSQADWRIHNISKYHSYSIFCNFIHLVHKYDILNFLAASFLLHGYKGLPGHSL